MQIHELFGLSEEEFNEAAREAFALPATEETLDRDGWGWLVRRIWLDWAKEQPTPKLSWLLPYEKLSEADKEVDRRIGTIIAALAWWKAKPLIDAERDRLAAIAASVHVGAGEAVRNG